jgi:CheY-like chemotaxis protein
MKLLIIDDDPGMAALLSRAIRKLGHEVVVGHTAHEALSKLREGSDVVIVDADLVGMNAIELVAVLRGIQPGVGVAFLASDDEVPRVQAFGPVLPRVWTIVQIRELLLHFERLRVRGSQPKLAPMRRTLAGPRATPSAERAPEPRPEPQAAHSQDAPMPQPPPVAHGSVSAPAETSEGRPPARKVRVQCRTWEQVSRLCEQHASGKTVLTLRGNYRFAEGEQLTVALALPDELVLALRAECTHVRRDPRGHELFGITLHGLTEDIRVRLERMVFAASTRPIPVMERPERAVSELTWE